MTYYKQPAIEMSSTSSSFGHDRFDKDDPCPVCSGDNGNCGKPKGRGNLVFCMTLAHAVGWTSLGRTPGGEWEKFVPEQTEELTPEQRAENRRLRDLRRTAAIETERLAAAEAMPALDRDKYYKRLLSQLSLHPSDRADLERRGFTSEQIKATAFVSVAQWQRLDFELPNNLPGVSIDGRSLNTPEPGYLCPIRDIDGLLVGCQVRTRAGADRKYYWLSSQTKKRPGGPQAKTREERENPLTVYRGGPGVALVEGTGAKPALAGARLGCSVIGAAGGQFPASRKTLARAIAGLGGPSAVTVCLDKGDLVNAQVMRRLEAVNAHLVKTGHTVGYWHSPDGDIDEVAVGTPIALVSWSEILRLKRVALGEDAPAAASSAAGERYLTAPTLPQGGGVLTISSAIGTGKTEAMKLLIAQARAINPSCLIESVGYRNALGQQSAQRLGLDHIHDLQGLAQSQLYIDSAQGLAYCVDSLHRRIGAVNAAIAQGHKVLVLLDEVDAVFKHLLMGATMGNRRAKILVAFCDMVRAVVAHGGHVVAAEADLGELPINFLRQIAAVEPTQVVNPWRADGWDVEMPLALNGDGIPSEAMASPGAVQRVLDDLALGHRIAVATDSQGWGETLDRLAAAEGHAVLRLDGQTSDEPWADELMRSPDAYLERVKPQLFIYSPSAESGLSITGDHFDMQVGYASHLEPRAQIQLMGRIRANIPRVVFAKSPQNGDLTPMTAAAVTARWTANAAASATAAAVETPQATELGQLLHSFAAQYQARLNTSVRDLRGTLILALTEQGHNVTESIQDLKLALKQIIKEEKAAVEVERSEAFAAAEVVPVAKAEAIARSTCASRSDRLSSTKTLLLESYPELPVDNAEFVLQNLVKSRGRLLTAHTTSFLVDHPEVAQAIDRQSWEAQAQNPIIWLPSIKRERPKADLYRRSGITRLMAMTEYQEGTTEVAAFRDFCLDNQAEIQQLLSLSCSADQTGIQMISKFARRLGYRCRQLRKSGPRGAQVRVYGWADDKGDRNTIHEALGRKWCNLPTLQPLQIEAASPVVTVSDIERDLTETVTTESESSLNVGDRVLIGGVIAKGVWQIKSFLGAIANLVHVDDWVGLISPVPISQLVPHG